MKKIIFSFLSLILVVAIVSASAYALFSSTATVSGLTFSTGNADLLISSIGTTWANTLTLTPAYTNMTANFTNSQEFYLKNNSLSNIGLNISAKLSESAPVNSPATWAAIGGKINIAFQKYNGTDWANLATGSISQWKDTGFNLDTLAFNTSQKYRLTVTTTSLGDADTGQTLSGLSFNFVGTQN